MTDKNKYRLIWHLENGKCRYSSGGQVPEVWTAEEIELIKTKRRNGDYGAYSMDYSLFFAFASQAKELGIDHIKIVDFHIEPVSDPVNENYLPKMKPILFSTPMVQALLAGRKTQTRRLVKFPKDYKGGQVWPNGQFGLKYESEIHLSTVERLHPPILAGDILYVRETFQELKSIVNGIECNYAYKADGSSFGDYEITKWKPSLFMPKEAARIFLQVTAVRAERLQEIGEADAIAEGIESLAEGWYKHYTHSPSGYGDPSYDFPTTNYPIHSFSTLWDSINAKKCPWDSNPWVWVYTFKRIEKP